MGGDPITTHPSPGMILQKGAPGFMVTTRLVVEATLLKHMIEKNWDHFPKDRDEHTIIMIIVETTTYQGYYIY